MPDLGAFLSLLSDIRHVEKKMREGATEFQMLVSKLQAMTSRPLARKPRRRRRRRRTRLVESGRLSAPKDTPSMRPRTYRGGMPERVLRFLSAHSGYYRPREILLALRLPTSKRRHLWATLGRLRKNRRLGYVWNTGYTSDVVQMKLRERLSRQSTEISARRSRWLPRHASMGGRIMAFLKENSAPQRIPAVQLGLGLPVEADSYVAVMLSRLKRAGLLRYAPGKGYTLTARGQSSLLASVR
jgi:hypothetical protein